MSTKRISKTQPPCQHKLLDRSRKFTTQDFITISSSKFIMCISNFIPRLEDTKKKETTKIEIITHAKTWNPLSFYGPFYGCPDGLIGITSNFSPCIASSRCKTYSKRPCEQAGSAGWHFILVGRESTPYKVSLSSTNSNHFIENPVVKFRRNPVTRNRSKHTTLSLIVKSEMSSWPGMHLVRW